MADLVIIVDINGEEVSLEIRGLELHGQIQQAYVRLDSELCHMLVETQPDDIVDHVQCWNGEGATIEMLGG